MQKNKEIPCIFEKEVGVMVNGYFHGFFQEGSQLDLEGVSIVALVEDETGFIHKIWDMESIKFN